MALVPSLPQPWEKAVASLTLVVGRFVQANIRRDAYIVDRIGEMVTAQPQSRILVRLGTAHIPVVRALIRRGIAARAVFQPSMRQFGFDVQAYRYVRYGRPLPVLAIGRMMAETVLKDLWLPRGRYLDWHRWTEAVGRVITKLTLEDLAQVWELYYWGELSTEFAYALMEAHGFAAEAL
jgi:hypothetical protein